MPPRVRAKKSNGKPRAPRVRKIIGDTPAERRAARKVAREECKAEQKRLRSWVPQERKRVAAEIEHMRAECEQACTNLRAQLAERIKQTRDSLRERVSQARAAARLGACVDLKAPPAPRRFGPRAPQRPKAGPEIFGDMLAAALEMAAAHRRTLHPALTIDQARHAFEDGWRGVWSLVPGGDPQHLDEYRELYELGRQGRETSAQPGMRISAATDARIDALEPQWRPLEGGHPLSRLGTGPAQSAQTRAQAEERARYYGTDRPPPSTGPRLTIPPPARVPTVPPDRALLSDDQLYDAATWTQAERTGRMARVRQGGPHGAILGAGEGVRLGPLGHEAVLSNEGEPEAIHPYPGARNGVDQWHRLGEFQPVHVSVFARTIPQQPAPVADTLETFARAVLSVAPTVAGFGPDRAYISAVYDALPPIAGGMATFKRRLFEAHKAHLLRLSRADLVGAMNYDHLRRSGIVVVNGTGHDPRDEHDSPQFHLIATTNRLATAEDGPRDEVTRAPERPSWLPAERYGKLVPRDTKLDSTFGAFADPKHRGFVLQWKPGTREFVRPGGSYKRWWFEGNSVVMPRVYIREWDRTVTLGPWDGMRVPTYGELFDRLMELHRDVEANPTGKRQRKRRVRASVPIEPAWTGAGTAEEARDKTPRKKGARRGKV